MSFLIALLGLVGYLYLLAFGAIKLASLCLVPRISFFTSFLIALCGCVLIMFALDLYLNLIIFLLTLVL